MPTYSNSARLYKPDTGSLSGTWGSVVNAQTFELVDEALSAVVHTMTSDANDSITISDGVASEARHMAIRVESSVSLTATRTLTLGPNTSQKVWIIYNATSGSQSLSISQGSGSNVTIENGRAAVVYADGAGSGAAVVLLVGHDVLQGFVANEHIDHSSVSINAGDGLTGGGTIAANRSLSVAFNGVTADDPLNGDLFAFTDVLDSNNLKTVTTRNLIDGLFEVVANVSTPSANDRILFYDIDDFRVEYQVIQSIPLTSFDDSSVGFTTHTASTLAFFSGTPVAQQSDPGTASITLVSGTGDDTTINNNFTNINSVVSSLRTALLAYALIA